MNKAYTKFSMYLLLSLLLTLIGSFIGSFLGNSFLNVLIILSFILLFAFMFSKGAMKKILFYIFCIGEGITLTPILYLYTGTSVFACLLITFIATLIFSIIGLRSKSLSVMRGILTMSLLALFVYSLVSLFIPLPSLALVGVILFCAYISYDINLFKVKVNTLLLTEEDILNSVMDLYLSILNLFMFILRLFGKDD